MDADAARNKVPTKSMVKAILGRATKFTGVMTVVLLVAWIVLLVFSIIAPGYAENCQDNEFFYYGCTWRGADVSYEINVVTWTSYLTHMLFLASGVLWLTMKCIMEWRNPEYSFARWWLVLLAMIVLFFFTAPRIVLWLAS